MENFTYRTEETKDGGITIIITRDGREFPLHSRINPAREGEKNAPVFTPEKYDLLIVLGCGMGYHLAGLKDNSGYRKIIVIDIIPGLEKVPGFLKTVPALAKAGNVVFITGSDPAEIEKHLTDVIDLDEIKGVQVVEHPGSFRLFPEYYESVKSGVRQVLDKKGGDRATVRAFGTLFLRNALNNLGNLHLVSPVSALAGRFSGESALIVSSAPSVENYIASIKSFRDSFYIIAVDSALPMLRAHGIIPEFAVSIDPQQRIGEHFTGHEGGGTSHIFSIASPPAIVERYGGYISLNSHPVSQVIEEFYPGVTGSIDSGTGSVAGDALNFAILAGFGNIGMTGFDFSFSGNNIYARETAYQNRYSLYYNNRVVTPESFNASYIFRGSGSLMSEGKYTRRSFIGYRDSLVKLIDRVCETPPVIINSGGLKVGNGRYMEFEDFAGSCGNPDKERGIPGDPVKMSDIVDRGKITGFINRSEVNEELLKQSLGTEKLSTRDKRFLKLLKI
ncbi:MAG TPA: DUF115 domain-containing protein [Spirochaetota bacterium]|nr:DUF115 domain-containing protein [Spirochaetota bacterium]